MQLLTIGMFVFSIKTAPFHEWDRENSYEWAENKRFGQGPAAQFVGLGAETRTLKGVLVPELTGGPDTLETLRRMSETGKVWPMVSGTGKNLGLVHHSISETGGALTSDGQARKITFTLKLKKYHTRRSAPADIGDLVLSLE